jgi:hypothetical protein
MKTNKLFAPFLSLWLLGNNLKSFYRRNSSSALYILIGIVLLSSDSIAQNFFPLKVGNAYQIKNDWWWVGAGGTGESGTDYYSLKVIRDTVINGQLFFGLLSNYEYPPLGPGHLFRYDSLEQRFLIITSNDTTTRLAVDFNAPADSHFTSYITGSPIDFISRGISSQIVMGDTQLVYLMEDIELPRNSYKFAAEIGLVQYKFYHAYYPPGYAYSATHNSISAVIDSFIFNPLILQVDTLYPVDDRPVDTFPYLLTINYTASYKELIDSFYISVEHLRADTLIQTKHYDVDWWNPHLTLFLSGLQAGDKVKLRATVTDTSIFHNVDYYPNTGWIVMNVLPSIVSIEGGKLPLFYELSQNYPNPFNPITTIRYQSPEMSFVVITIYDILGNMVEKLVSEEKIAGSYEIEFDGSGLTSGIYYYRITAGNFSQTKKMILLK